VDVDEGGLSLTLPGAVKARLKDPTLNFIGNSYGHILGVYFMGIFYGYILWVCFMGIFYRYVL
jgi:hypothetical protein